MAPNKKGVKKQQSNKATPVASGASTPAVRAEPVKAGPAYIGINFGQSFSSIAVINKEGLADCIANDDGERQIASALSFNGEEEYSGVPARVQLVRNAQNTIVGFRNLLGKSYDQVKSVKQPVNSAPIVDHNGEPAFTVQINDQATTLTAHEVAVRYLKVLLQYAQDFLGRPITAAVLSAPSDFSANQVAALAKAAEEAGLRVAQTITETGAALNAYASTEITEAEPLVADRNTVVLDVGGSSTSVTVVAVRDGLFTPLATVSDATLGGDLFDEKLMDFFGKEFTKKTRIPLESSNHRGLMKLRLAVEVTKKSLSASNTAPCSVEALAEGMDFHGSINRMRFDLLAATIYSRIVAKVEEAVAAAKLDPLQIQEVILVGGTTRLPALADKLYGFFNEDTTTLTAQIDPDEVIAKGSALHAVALPEDHKKADSVFARALNETTVSAPSATAAPIGLTNGEAFFTLVEANTPLPLRRIVELDVASGASEVLISLAEGAASIEVSQPVKEEKSKPGLLARLTGSGAAASDDEDEDDEPEEVRTVVVKPTKQVAEVKVAVDSKSKAKVQVTVIVGVDGKGEVKAVQLKEGAAEAKAAF